MEFTRCFGCMEEKREHPICEHCGFDERQQNLPHQLPTGTILQGHYLLGKVLGQGGFGITYLAWDLYLQIPVAIKEYYPSGLITRSTDRTGQITCATGSDAQLFERSKRRFLQEGQTLAKFQDLHNIVKIHGLFPENNTVYLVMEYARGQTLLKTLQARGPMQLQQILDLLGPIMEDLQKLHSAGVIHRDISPDNIMLLQGGGAKLLDFGAVRQVEEPNQGKPISRSTEAILKQGFAPIEQYNGRGTLGPWTDVYAMCATICYCLSGKVPPPAPDRVYEETADGFIDALPIGPRQKDVLRRGMALKPGDRTTSMTELFRQLKASLQPAPPPVSPAPRPPAPAPRKSGLLWLIPAGILAAAAVLAVILVLPGLRKNGEPAEDRPASEEVTEPVTQAATAPALETEETTPGPALVTEETTQITAPETVETTPPLALEPGIPRPQVGDFIWLGTYRQMSSRDQGSPVSWKVLAVEEDRALVISAYGLEARRFHEVQEAVDWENCTLRQWLNGGFFYEAFTEEERNMILTTRVPGDRNPRFPDLDPGRDTEDRIFILSLPESEAYLLSDSDRRCMATAYAVAQGAWVDPGNGCSWWLYRTPGDRQDKVASTCCDGTVDYDGGSVTSPKGVVRPVMWVRIR